MATPTTDPVTGLWSSAQVIAHVTSEFARAAAAGLGVSVAVADLDDFSEVAGIADASDRVAILKQAAARLRGSLRRTDAVGRYAGEEFLVVLDPTSRGQAVDLDPCLVMERARRAVADRPFRTAAGFVTLSVSIGVATGRPEHTDPANVIAAAVKALYRAKVAGNCVHVSSMTVGA